MTTSVLISQRMSWFLSTWFPGQWQTQFSWVCSCLIPTATPYRDRKGGMKERMNCSDLCWFMSSLRVLKILARGQKLPLCGLFYRIYQARVALRNSWKICLNAIKMNISSHKLKLVSNGWNFWKCTFFRRLIMLDLMECSSACTRSVGDNLDNFVVKVANPFIK